MRAIVEGGEIAGQKLTARGGASINPYGRARESGIHRARRAFEI